MVSSVLKKHKIVVLFFLVFSILMPVDLSSQEKRTKTIAELSIDNDIVFLIDRYYSSGVTLTLYHNWLKKSPLNYILLSHQEDEIAYYSMNIKHCMFTPEKTLTPRIVYNDRPYATYFLVGGSKTSFNHNSRLKKFSQIEFGVIGPAAGGEQIQNKLHDNISIAQHSEGWHNQIRNDICLQYNVTIEKGIINTPYWEVNGFFNGAVGVPHTELQIGGYTRAGTFHDYFRGLGIDISNDFNLWVELSGSFYLVNYNATLQGGITYNRNVHTINPINNTLIQGTLGAVIEYKRIHLKYGMVVRSPEFYGAFWHRWANLKMAIVL